MGPVWGRLGAAGYRAPHGWYHWMMISLPSGKLTWQWNIPFFSRKYIFKGSIFHCYVRLPECIFVQSKQCTINGKSLKFSHIFALFDAPQIGNLMIPACWRLGANTSLWQQIQSTNGSPKSVLATHLLTNVHVFFFMDIFRCNIYINIYTYTFTAYLHIYIYLCIYNLSNLHSGHSFFLGLFFSCGEAGSRGRISRFLPRRLGLVLSSPSCCTPPEVPKVRSPERWKNTGPWNHPSLLWVFVGISGIYMWYIISIYIYIISIYIYNIYLYIISIYIYNIYLYI